MAIHIILSFLDRTMQPAAVSEVDRVEPAILCGFPDLVAELGGDPDFFLRQAGIDPDDVRESQSALGYRQIVVLIARTAEALDCEDFGMRLAARQVYAMQTPLMHVLRYSRTLGEAWELVGRHSYAHSLAAAIWLRHSDTDATVMLGHDILLEGLHDKRQATEQILLAIHLSCRIATGNLLRPRRVEFRHQPLSPPATYRGHFGCDVRFGQPADMIVYGEDALTCPIALHDPLSFSLAVERIDADFQQQPLHVTVRGVITHVLTAGPCSNQQVAEMLSIHPRTLHRRLEEQGTSFQRVKNEVRRDMLVHYLDHSDFPLSDISERLGFAEQSAMSRFCQRWLGQSPSERRARACQI